LPACILQLTPSECLSLRAPVTFCRPCKKFEPLYKQFATRFPDARFLRINGNENPEMVHIGRDRLGVKSSPSFYFFRNGQEVHRHSGAKAEKFEESILKFCADRTLPPLP
jgi:thiol-disulfide isomerase/thioredoxin